MAVRVLLLADTHLGFDFPLRPRVERRRRGPDFFTNTREALAPARRGDIDLVVHGGDLLYRSKVPAEIVRLALEPLLEVADAGVPVVLVPGNHERSALPFPLLAAHSHFHAFDRPRTIELDVAGRRVALAGFPCQRKSIRDSFADLVSKTRWEAGDSDLSLLCLHQTVEGAVVGPHDYVFRSGPDIIRGRDLPAGFAAVVTGHIHRHQVLTRDLGERPLAAPVFFPGSIERTSAAERDEAKGFLMLEFEPDRNSGGRLGSWEFRKLPARPMIDIILPPTDPNPEDLGRWLRTRFADIDSEAVIRIRISGPLDDHSREVIRAASLRKLSQPTQTVEVSWPRRKS